MRVTVPFGEWVAVGPVAYSIPFIHYGNSIDYTTSTYLVYQLRIHEKVNVSYCEHSKVFSYIILLLTTIVIYTINTNTVENRKIVQTYMWWIKTLRRMERKCHFFNTKEKRQSAGRVDKLSWATRSTLRLRRIDKVSPIALSHRQPRTA